MSQQDNIRNLTEDQCWKRLATREFGRLAYHLADEVHIVPINYAVDAGRIIFRTAEGSKLLGVVMNPDVAFEVDDITDGAETAWSIIGRGPASVLEGVDALAADNLPLRPWIDTEKFNVVAVTLREISGREFDLHRPWNSMMPR